MEQDVENFLHLAGPNDIIDNPWGSVPDPRPLFDEYTRQNIGTVLAMAQRIHSGNLTVADGQTIDPFALLMSTTRYQRALSSFSGIRGTLVLRCTLRSAATAYGVGMAWWYYGPTRYTAQFQQDMEIATSSHCMIIDIAPCPEVIFRIPFIHAREFLPIGYTNYVSFGEQYIALKSLDPAIPPTAYHEVWAHMEDVEVTKYIEAQSLPVAVRQQEYNLPGRASLPLVLAGSGAIVGATQAVVSNFLTQGYTDLKKAIYQEVKQKVTSNPETKTKEENKPVEHVDKSQNVCANTQTPTYNAPWGNVNSFEPTHALQSMTEMPMTKMDPAILGDVEYHGLADLVQNATWEDAYVFQNTTARITTDITAANMSGYAGYISRHFRYFRGRPRIGFWFSCSPLMSARFLIRVGSPGSIGAVDHDDASVAMHSLLIKGSSYHVLEVPWNHDSPIYPTDLVHSSFSIELISKGEPTTAGYDFEIRVLVFTSFGPGAQFFSVKSPNLSQPPPIIEGQSSTRDINRGEPDICFTQGPLHPITYLDPVDSVETLCSRWATDLSRKKDVANETAPRDTISYAWPNTYQNNLYGSFPQHFIPLYTTWRGSRDFRFIPNVNLSSVEKATMAGSEIVSTWSDLSIANGGFIITAATPHQFRIPFLTRYKSLLSTPGAAVETTPVPTTALTLTDDTTVIARASPDFQLFHLNALYPGFKRTTFYEPGPP